MSLEEQILENQNLIKSIATKFSLFHDFDDLVQAGTIGFMKAFQNFDETQGVKLTTYAYQYILGEMKQYIYKDKGVKISRDIINLNRVIEKARITLEQQLMREPRTEELALFLEMEEQTVIDVMQTSFQIASLDEVITDDENEITRYDSIIKEETDLDTLIMLRDEVSKLKEPERSLIIHRYFEDNSQQETANKLGMSQVQVSRVEAKTLKLLRDKIAA